MPAAWSGGISALLYLKTIILLNVCKRTTLNNYCGPIGLFAVGPVSALQILKNPVKIWFIDNIFKKLIECLGIFF